MLLYFASEAENKLDKDHFESDLFQAAEAPGLRVSRAELEGPPILINKSIKINTLPEIACSRA